MIRSIRHFLLASLLISITIASSITAIGNYITDKQVIQPYLDEHLVEVFSFIKLLGQHIQHSDTVRKQIYTYFEETPSRATKNIAFQVWDNDGKLLLHSSTAASGLLKNVPLGFSDKQINGNNWRIYAGLNPATSHKIVVAELYNLRNKLADDITRNNAYILLVTYPIFGLLIWMIVGVALRSISRVTNEISNRASTHLDPVDTANTPIEIKPLLVELNHLFQRLKHAFDRNKRFAADAAHELRTPLAAVKTQTQVALKAEDAKERDHALHKVIEGVDRSSHVVAQLLILSRLSQEEELNDVHPTDLHKLATEIIAYLVPIALEKNIEIELAPSPNKMILGNDTALGILIRNIVDNAIRYTPSGSEIKIQILRDKQQLIFRVIDTGPGIPTELHERVFERFYRILGTTASGSGLGLAIVSQIAELHHAQIHLSSPAKGGLQFDVIFPIYHPE